MCLYDPKRVHKLFRRTKEPITCYKILEKDSHGGFKSPFQEFPYELGVPYDLGKRLKIERIEFDRKCKCISEGFHSIKTLELAWLYLHEHDFQGEMKIFKCSIPAGSKVYISEASPFREMVSDKIIILEDVTGEAVDRSRISKMWWDMI